MTTKTNLDPKVVDFKSAKAVKDFIETASDRILQLEDAHYAILDCHRIDVIKEISAEVLGEDLESYMEEDIAGVKELDFENDTDDNMGLPWDEYDT
jgi:hypothetical protein